MQHEGRIKGLDGLRAIAVTLVVVNHKLPIGWWLLPGGYGVHLFFVLSGFLIISILAKRREALVEGASNLRIELWHFYENRAYRIWPIYYLGIAIAVALGALGLAPAVSKGLLLSAATFTTNLLIAFKWHDYPSQLGPIWSVAVEEQFYLWAAPVFLMCAARRYVSIYTIVIATAIAFAAWVFWSGYSQRAIYVGPLTNFGLMALGGLAATNIRYRPWMAVTAPWLTAAYLACIPIGHHYEKHAVILYAASWGSALLVAPILLGAAGNAQTVFVRFLELPPIKYIGRISYGIYIYHGFIDIGARAPALKNSPNLLGLMDAAVAIAVASASWHILEKPLLDMKSRRRQRAAEIRAARAQIGA